MKQAQYWAILSLGMLILVVGFLLLYPIIRMGYTLQINYNEGWNAYHSLKVTSGRELYDLKNTWTPNNYPPLSFYIVGGIGNIFGNPILVGRYLSFISLICVGVLTGNIVKQLGGKNYEAFFSGIFCLGLVAATAESYVGMNDPQMLAHAFVLGGFLLYLRDRDQLWLPALLIVIGLFIKHILLPIPIAIALDSLLFSPKKFLKWSSFSAILLASFTAIACLVDGVGFIQQISADRAYDWGRMIGLTIRTSTYLIIPLIFALPQFIHLTKNKSTRILSIYFLISLLLGCIAFSGLGVYRNLFFDVYISLSIILGLLLANLQEKYRFSSFQKQLLLASLPLVLSLELAIALFWNQPNPIRKIQNLQTLEQSFLADINFVKRQSGDAICENLVLCFYAGKPWRYDPFMTAQMMYKQKIDETEVLAALETEHFSLVQLNQPLDSQFLANRPNLAKAELHTDRFTVNFLRTLGKHYTLVRTTQTGAFYSPQQLSPTKKAKSSNPLTFDS